MIVTSYFHFHLMKEFYIAQAQAQGLEIRFSNFPIMVIGSHDFPCFFLVENHVFPPIINNFLPIIDRLPWIATSEATSLCHRLYNKHTCREASPGLDAPRVAGSFPNPTSHRLPWIATSEATSLCHRLYNKHTCREASPGLDALRVAGSFPNSPCEARWVRETSSHPRCVQSRTHRTCKYVWFLSHAISVKSTE